MGNTQDILPQLSPSQSISVGDVEISHFVRGQNNKTGGKVNERLRANQKEATRLHSILTPDGQPSSVVEIHRLVAPCPNLGGQFSISSSPFLIVPWIDEGELPVA